jgi:hypothetical protein
MVDCRYRDPLCPCNDGDPCNYEDNDGTRGLLFLPIHLARELAVEIERLRGEVDRTRISLANTGIKLMEVASDRDTLRARIRAVVEEVLSWTTATDCRDAVMNALGYTRCEVCHGTMERFCSDDEHMRGGEETTRCDCIHGWREARDE